ncbi:MAG: dihydrolipoyl dehydrogenase [Clostridia bacterium]|nr:dihydrolipoyl dehydrogenase [Clostridia bacterium]
MAKYDLIILGGGPAGYNAAERAAEAGLKTLLYEQRALGGVCLNEGCIPTKTFLYSAKLKDGAEHGKPYGVVCEGVSIDQPAVVARKDKVVKALVGGVGSSMRDAGVEVKKESGKIAGRTDEGLYTVEEADGSRNEAQYLLIATGSEAAMPPIPGLKEQFERGFVLTNREILDLQDVPEKLTVIGGGVIGMEMASYFNSAGSKVTVIEMLDQVGGPIDSEIAELLRKNYEKKGVSFELGAKVVRVDGDGVVFERNGREDKVAADKVLVSVGRTPNSAGIGLETIGVATERGRVLTDDKMKTSQPNVYAAGDVNGRSMLAHTAYREGEVAVNNMTGRTDHMKYNAIPAVIYTNPEVATVGETEESAREKGMDVAVVRLPMNYSGRYMAENDGGDGIIKLVVNRKTNAVVGVHMIANYSSELIWGADALITREVPLEGIKKIVFPHPTVAEIIREAVYHVQD